MNDDKKFGCSISVPGFGSLLTILFIALKLCHVIDWAWVWVLAPLWISAAITVVIFVIAMIIAIIINS